MQIIHLTNHHLLLTFQAHSTPGLIRTHPIITVKHGFVTNRCMTNNDDEMYKSSSKGQVLNVSFIYKKNVYTIFSNKKKKELTR